MTFGKQKPVTETHWEASMGLSRVRRIGPFVHVEGTTATDAQGKSVGIDVNDSYRQIVFILQKIKAALESIDASLVDVVRTRIYRYRTDIPEVMERVAREIFGENQPVATIVLVETHSGPMTIQIEVDAVVASALK